MTEMARVAQVALVLTFSAGSVHADTGQAAWLRYARLDSIAIERAVREIPPAIITLAPGAAVQKARDELVSGIRGMAGIDLRPVSLPSVHSAIVIGTLKQVRLSLPELLPDATLQADGY